MAISKGKLAVTGGVAAGIGGFTGGLIELGNINTSLTKDLDEEKKQNEQLLIRNDTLGDEVWDLIQELEEKKVDNKGLEEINIRLMNENEQYALSQFQLDKEIEKTYDINEILSKLGDIVSNTIEVDISPEDRNRLDILNRNLLTVIHILQSNATTQGLLYHKMDEVLRKLESSKPS